MREIDAICRAILDGFTEPVVFVDTEHVTRYMNEEAAAQYKKWGGYDIIGKSIMDCHDEKSCQTIREAFDRMASEGMDEVEIYRRPGKIAYMAAVRDENGKLLGYYERFRAADNPCKSTSAE